MLSSSTRDLIGRGTLTFYFAICATLKVLQIIASHGTTLDLIANIATLGFMLLIVAMTLIRLPPVNSAEGISPRVVALLGAFATVTFVALPPIEVSPELRIASDVLVIVGFSLCVWCLWWLGRSFSVMAQARRLVTGGPYRYVRHPLYVCEVVALAGIILRNPTWPAFVIAAVALLFQYLRIKNEENVLRGTFPEYNDYARSTPMLVPTLR